MTQIQDWIGAIPVMIELDPRDNIFQNSSPQPLFFLLPRSSYLLCVMHTIREVFSPFAASLGCGHHIWLTRNDVAVPWQYSVGALWDCWKLQGVRAPLVLIARVSTSPDPDGLVAQCVPLTSAGVASSIGQSPPVRQDPTDGSMSAASPQRSMMQILEQAKIDASAAISMYIKNYVKGSLAAAFGSSKQFFLLNMKNVEAIIAPLTCHDIDAFEKTCKPSVDAAEDLIRRCEQAAQDHSVVTRKLPLLVFDSRQSIVPLATALPWPSAESTFADFVVALFDSLQLRKDPASRQSEIISGNNALQMMERHELVVLVGGVDVPFEAPMREVFRRFRGFDLRLSVVVGIPIA